MKILIFLVFVANAAASDWFLSQAGDAVNNGASWTHAWTNMSSVKFGSGGLVAGDTLYIAGGYEYTNDSTGDSFQLNHYFKPTVSGTPASPITIRRARATNSACSSVSGWTAALDDRPIIHNCYFSGGCSNFVFDGEIPYVGLMITNSINNGNCFDIVGGLAFCTVRNCEIVGSGYTNNTWSTQCWHSDGAGLNLSNRLSYCVIRNAPTLITTGNSAGTIIENCVLANTLTGDTVNNHPNLWFCTYETNGILRNCLITNWGAEGIILNADDTHRTQNLDVYGNVWDDSMDAGGSSRILESRSGANGPIRFYNNTVISNTFGLLTNGGTWTGCVSSNNIYFGDGSVDFDASTSDYNLSWRPVAGSHSIVNASLVNALPNWPASYQISSVVGVSLPKDKGANLGAYYQIDAGDNTRGADAAWDIGAFEYVGATANITTLNVGTLNFK